MSFAVKKIIIVALGVVLQILLLLFSYLFIGEHFVIVDTIYQIVGVFLMLGLIIFLSPLSKYNIETLIEYPAPRAEYCESGKYANSDFE